MAYQSLYRRYRPQTFAEIRGQPHIVNALRNAVAKDEVGHAYLFHGPRGTGKTTSARVLAKALNCENLGDDGEPCGTCESCVAIEEGRSFDLHELDAASNNRVDDMRDLLAKVSLGTPGRAKVYILDEVHMLTSGAENALLKTLEEPPDHVVWVLATTEPHKVVQTIRSRCQVFELGLLGAEEMAEHVRWVIADADLDVGDGVVDHVVTVGGGSVRDTLSALDRVVAAGGVVELDDSTDVLLAALADRDVTAALVAVGDALGRGRDPRTIGESALGGLRDAFLTAMGTPPPRLTPPEQQRAADIAERMSAAAMTRGLETLGSALVEMRQAPDPRVDLEVALVRLCRPDADGSVDALIARVDQLEAALAGGAAPAPRPASSVASTDPSDDGVAVARTDTGAAPVVPPPPPPPQPSADPPSPAVSARGGRGPAAAARQALADAGAAPRSAPEAAPPAAPSPAPAPTPDPAPVAAADSITAIQPDSPSDVVRLAAEHLSLDRDIVVRRATELLGPADGPRPAADLARLWSALVEEFGGDAAAARSQPDPGPEPDPSPPEPDPEPERAPEPPIEPDPSDSHDELHEVDAPLDADESVSNPEPAAEPDDAIDLTDLVDAPDRAEEVIDRLTEAFPGAELQSPEEPEQ